MFIPWRYIRQIIPSASHLTLCIELPCLLLCYLFAFIERCLVAGVTLCHICFVSFPIYFCVRDAIFSGFFNSGWVRDFRISKRRCWRFKLLILFTRRHNVTSQKTWIFNCGSVRLAPSVWGQRRVTVYSYFLSPWTRTIKITSGFPYGAVMNLNYALSLKSTCRGEKLSLHWNHHVKPKCCYLSNDVRGVVYQ